MKIRVLGQDPSMNNWGLVAADIDIETMTVVVLDMLVVVNLKKDIKQNKTVRRSVLDLERSRDIHAQVHSFTKQYDPQFTMVEVPHGSQSASAMKGYGICLGILGSFEMSMIPLTEQECKINSLGKKSSTKAEIISWAFDKQPDANWKMKNLKGQRVSVDGYNEHIADALSAIYAGMYSDQFIQAMTFAKKLSQQ
jgi:hypothetical protein